VTNTASPTSLQNRFLLLLFIAFLCVIDWRGSGAMTMPALVLGLPLVIGFASLYTVHLMLILIAMYLAARFTPWSDSLIGIKTSGVIFYFYIVLLIAPLRRTLTWVRPGKLSRGMLIWMLAIAVIASLTMVAWDHFMIANSQAHVPAAPPASLKRFTLGYMIAFALLNALAEEIIWRGVMMTALESAFGAGLFALLLQGMQFGLAHYRGGFPSGWLGAFLASLFGIAMGLLRRRTNGMLVPWCAHAAVDFAIICLIVHRAGL
jgi:hypothetical protein